MIITSQPFLNELDQLEIKFETLKGVVDLHVVYESSVTFSGVNKPLYFEENKERFAKYPIHYFNVDHINEKTEKMYCWDREHAQREAVLNEINKINPEIVIFGDADESIKPEVIEKFKSLKCETANLELDMLLYYFNRQHPDPWPYHRITYYKNKTPDRGNWSFPKITDAGWHFEYFGNQQTLLEKINATSHAIETGGREFYKQVRRGEKPKLESCTEYPIEKLPQFVQDNQERFKDWFKS